MHNILTYLCTNTFEKKHAHSCIMQIAIQKINYWKNHKNFKFKLHTNWKAIYMENYVEQHNVYTGNIYAWTRGTMRRQENKTPYETPKPHPKEKKYWKKNWVTKVSNTLSNTNIFILFRVLKRKKYAKNIVI